jgi:hypothetical protein
VKCHLYMRSADGRPLKLGPFDVSDDEDARSLAEAELSRRPQVNLIDVWCDHGELYRVERPSERGRNAADAWASAFRCDAWRRAQG